MKIKNVNELFIDIVIKVFHGIKILSDQSRIF